MGLLDILIGIPLVWGLWKGLKNGLFMEIASIVALIAGIYGAIHFSYLTGDYLSERFEWDGRNMSIIAFVITLILIIVVVHLAGKLLTKVANIAMLGMLNKIAGGLFGILKVAILLGALLVFFERMDSQYPLLDSKTRNESILYIPIKDIGALLFERVLESDILQKETSEESITI